MNSENTKRTIEYIRERLKDCLSSTLYKFPLPDDEKYPIEFENGMGKWSIEKDGTASFQPITPVQSIKIDINIKKMERINCADLVKNPILIEVEAERIKQDSKWGEQNHEPFKWVAILGEEFGEVAKATLENDPHNYREELIQVAAVAVAAIENFDRVMKLNGIDGR